MNVEQQTIIVFQAVGSSVAVLSTPRFFSQQFHNQGARGTYNYSCIVCIHSIEIDVNSYTAIRKNIHRPRHSHAPHISASQLTDPLLCPPRPRAPSRAPRLFSAPNPGEYTLSTQDDYFFVSRRMPSMPPRPPLTASGSAATPNTRSPPPVPQPLTVSGHACPPQHALAPQGRHTRRRAPPHSRFSSRNRAPAPRAYVQPPAAALPRPPFTPPPPPQPLLSRS